MTFWVLSWLLWVRKVCSFFFFKQKTAYEIRLSLVGSEMCIRDRAITVLLQTKRNHNFTNMDKDEAARVRAAWKPVIEKLPDYAYLCDEILREAQENEEENGIDLQ